MTLIRQGEGPAAAYLRHQREREREQQQLERILQLASPEVDNGRPSRATAPGDIRKLRGIPVIARGVPGDTNA